MPELFKTESGDHIIGDENMVSKQELKVALDVSISTIQRFMRQGMPYTRYVNFIAYNPTLVLEWLKKKGHGDPKLISRFKKISKMKVEKEL